MLKYKIAFREKNKRSPLDTELSEKTICSSSADLFNNIRILPLWDEKLEYCQKNRQYINDRFFDLYYLEPTKKPSIGEWAYYSDEENTIVFIVENIKEGVYYSASDKFNFKEISKIAKTSNDRMLGCELITREEIINWVANRNRFIWEKGEPDETEIFVYEIFESLGLEVGVNLNEFAVQNLKTKLITYKNG